jgi:sugar/nucleoside kinase (ribokinase family)
MSILTVGSVAYDGLETPTGKRDRILGGAATYISMAASYLSNNVRLVGVVGNDFADEDMNRLKARNIDLEGLQVDNTGKCFFWRGKYHENLNERDTLETQLNVFEHFDPIIPESYQNSDVVALGNIVPALQGKVLDQVKNPKYIVMDTMNLWIDIARKDLLKTIARVDMLIINDGEARQITGESNLIVAAKKIRELGPRHLIIKKGEHGALLFTEDDRFSAPAFPLNIINDPTGAGDCFLGGFVGWLDKKESLDPQVIRQAVIFGSVLASFCVENFGPESLYNLSEKAIFERFESFRKLGFVAEL